MDSTINISKLDKTTPELTNSETPYGLESVLKSIIKANNTLRNLLDSYYN